MGRASDLVNTIESNSGRILIEVNFFWCEKTLMSFLKAKFSKKTLKEIFVGDHFWNAEAMAISRSEHVPTR